MQHIIHYPFTYLKLSKPTPYQLWCMVLLRPCKCRPATRLTDSLCVSAGHPPHCWNSVPVINTRALMNRGQGVDKLSVNSVGHVEFTVDYLQHTSSCCAFFFISQHPTQNAQQNKAIKKENMYCNATINYHNEHESSSVIKVIHVLSIIARLSNSFTLIKKLLFPHTQIVDEA